MSVKKLGTAALTALVLSSMLGAGVFSLPQNMASVAGPAALLIGWTITGFGIFFLALALLYLTRLKPELDGGIFSYARQGFGEVTGFIAAWGYWLCAVIANASYLVVVMSALSFFTDSPQHILFGEGNTWLAMLIASLLLWTVHFLVLRGIETAASINILATIGKLVPLLLFIILASLAFNYSVFINDFKGMTLHQPLWSQVKQTMLITLWVFIGVEGAVVVSSRARNKKDVGLATMLAVSLALLTYLLVTLLSLGVMPRQELAEFRNPSMAGLLHAMMGEWGTVIIVVGIILSVTGAYLSWTIMAAEIPFQVALTGSLPASISKQNHRKSPAGSLWLTNSCVQCCLIGIAIFHADYNQLLTIASEMVLVPYLLVGLYLSKLAYRKPFSLPAISGFFATIYGLWLIFAAGWYHLLMSLLLYAPGVLLFLYARYGKTGLQPLNFRERTLIFLVITGAVLILIQGLLT